MKLIKLKKESLKKIGYRQTYDLEIDDINHNFIINDTIVTSNSHSLAYSINAYICMWLKVYYPLEYFATLFNYSSLDEMTSLFKLAGEQGIQFNDFVANEVGENFSVDYEKRTIKMGLKSVKGLPVKDIQKLLEVRLRNLDDLLNFVKNEKLGKKAIETLCRLQYFKNIYPNSKALEQLIFKVKETKSLEQENLFPETGNVKELDMITDYTISEQLKFQLDYLGYYIGQHPFYVALEAAEWLFEKMKMKMYSPKEAYNKDNNFVLFGIVTAMKLKKTKTGKDYFNIIVEDDVKQIEIKVWNPQDVMNVKIGSAIAMDVENSKFGFSKLKNGSVLNDLIGYVNKKKELSKTNNNK